MSAGTVTTGFVVSGGGGGGVTVTVKLSVSSGPEESLATQLTVVTPTGKWFGDGTPQSTVSDAPVASSVAVGTVNVTSAPVESVAATVMSGSDGGFQVTPFALEPEPAVRSKAPRTSSAATSFLMASPNR